MSRGIRLFPTLAISTLVAALLTAGCTVGGRQPAPPCPPCSNGGEGCVQNDLSTSQPACAEPQVVEWEDIAPNTVRFAGCSGYGCRIEGDGARQTIYRSGKIPKRVEAPNCNVSGMPSGWTCTYNRLPDETYERYDEECPETYVLMRYNGETLSAGPVRGDFNMAANPWMRYPVKYVNAAYPYHNSNNRVDFPAIGQLYEFDFMKIGQASYLGSLERGDSSDERIAKYGPLLKYNHTIFKGGNELPFIAGRMTGLIEGDFHYAPFFDPPSPELANIDLAPVEVQRALTARHHLWCKPGRIKAVCTFNGESGGGGAPAPTGSPAAAPAAQCPAGLGGVLAKTEETRTLADALPGVLGAARDTEQEAGNTDTTRLRDVEQSTSKARADLAKNVRGGGGGGRGGSGGGSASPELAIGGGPGINLGTSAGSGGAGGGDSQGTASADDLSAAGSGSAAATEEGTEQETASANQGGAQYESAGGGGGAKGKGSADPFAGLFGSLGGKGAGAGQAGPGGASAVGFGKSGAQGPDSPGMTDAELEAMLERNRGSSLFEIANRRYFKFGRGVMSQEASEALRKSY